MIEWDEWNHKTNYREQQQIAIFFHKFVLLRCKIPNLLWAWIGQIGYNDKIKYNILTFVESGI